MALVAVARVGVAVARVEVAVARVGMERRARVVLELVVRVRRCQVSR